MLKLSRNRIVKESREGITKIVSAVLVTAATCWLLVAGCQPLNLYITRTKVGEHPVPTLAVEDIILMQRFIILFNVNPITRLPPHESVKHSFNILSSRCKMHNAYISCDSPISFHALVIATSRMRTIIT